MSDGLLCRFEGCRAYATHRIVLVLRSGLFASPVHIPYMPVCSLHSKAQWHQVMPASKWNKYQKAAMVSGVPVPDRLYSTLKVEALTKEEIEHDDNKWKLRETH